jgi:RNA ligase (TIGR02306 family)
VCFGYVPGLQHQELYNGSLYAASKGLHAKGFVFKDTQLIKPKISKKIPIKFIRNWINKKYSKTVKTNQDNLYHRTLLTMVAKGFIVWLEEIAKTYNAKTIHVFGEIYGKGIQDLDYGFSNPTVGIFDVAVNNQFLPYDDLLKIFENQEFAKMIPALYVGPYNYETILKFRDGPSTLGGKHIREGVVVTSTTENTHIKYGRKIAKFISPNYLLRKAKDGSEPTEYQ